MMLKKKMFIEDIIKKLTYKKSWNRYIYFCDGLIVDDISRVKIKTQSGNLAMYSVAQEIIPITYFDHGHTYSLENKLYYINYPIDDFGISIIVKIYLNTLIEQNVDIYLMA